MMKTLERVTRWLERDLAKASDLTSHTNKLADSAAGTILNDVSEESITNSFNKILSGPVKKGLIGIGGTFAAAEGMDMAHRARDKAEEGHFARLEKREAKRKERQRLADEQIYEEEMEEAYKKGLFLDYTEDATKNKYKALGYQPGLPGDPNLNLVQNLYTRRTNHTRMGL